VPVRPGQLSLHQAVAVLEPECLSGPDAQKLYTRWSRSCGWPQQPSSPLPPGSSPPTSGGSRAQKRRLADRRDRRGGGGQPSPPSKQARPWPTPPDLRALRDGKLSEPQVKELPPWWALPGHRGCAGHAARSEPMRALKRPVSETRPEQPVRPGRGPGPAIHAIATCAIGPTNRGLVPGGRFTPTGGPRSSPYRAAPKERFEQARKNGDREPWPLCRRCPGRQWSVGLLSKDAQGHRERHCGPQACSTGDPEGDQVSAIDGIGEVPSPSVESLLSDASVKVLFYQGKEVNTICHPALHRCSNPPLHPKRPTLLCGPGCGSTKF